MSQWLLENLFGLVMVGNIYAIFIITTSWLRIRKLEINKAGIEKYNLELELKIMELERNLNDANEKLIIVHNVSQEPNPQDDTIIPTNVT